MTPEEFIKIKSSIQKAIDELNEVLYQARLLADTAKPPPNRRPARPKDIVTGAVIWYEGENEWYWLEVEEVLSPDDSFKAYLSEGSRYGLHEAWVRKGITNAKDKDRHV